MIENKILKYYFLVLLMVIIGIAFYAFLLPAMLGEADTLLVVGGTVLAFIIGPLEVFIFFKFIKKHIFPRRES
jgi:undecaprenyl pyrophosphate phosphatase UppP